MPVGDPASPRRARLLGVLDSRHRLASDYGRAVFALADRLRRELDLELAIDDADRAQADVLAGFCAPRGVPLHVGDLGAPLARRFDAIECVLTAAPATRAVLESEAELPLLYTPGPPGSEDAELVRRAAVVLCRSAAQVTEVRALSPDAACVRAAPGADFDAFAPGRFERGHGVVATGERAALRRGFDRVAEAFAVARELVPKLRLKLVGAGAGSAAAPEGLDVLTDVGPRERARLLADAAVLLWLGEAPDSCAPPVVEALACGTPAVVSDLPGPRELYERWPAVAFASPADPVGLGEVVAAAVCAGPARALVDREAARAVHDWGVLARARAAAVRGVLGAGARR
jgi:glycosyltransferase involved in cell wall biosynthesis